MPTKIIAKKTVHNTEQHQATPSNTKQEQQTRCESRASPSSFLTNDYHTPLFSVATAMPRKHDRYIRLVEVDTAVASLEEKTILLRNIAATPAARSFSRTDVLDSLMPLSRNPWSNTPTLISNATTSRSLRRQKQ
ncbi:hypothetical protein BGW39_009248 [Mortierella sp. 14UC]|nr:hypothetical protein BGW39_009248 [Mortierella sp. 14UC]